MKHYLIRFKGTLIAFVIFIVLLGSLFLFDREKHADTQAEKVFPDILPEEIISIRLKNPASEIVLEKGEDGWMLVTDSGKHRADGAAVEELIRDITGMEIEKKLPEGDTKLDEYGFVRSGTEFSVTTGHGDYPVIVGDKSPVGSGIYIYDLGDGRVMIVSDRYLGTLRDKRPSDFRESKLLNLAADKVDRIFLSVGGFSVELGKENGKWVGIPEPDAVDQTAISELLSFFSELKASGIEDDSPEDLSVYGLTEPVAEIGFYAGGSGVTASFGKRKDEKDYYLKVGPDDAVYSVSKEYFKMLPKNIDQIRER